MLEILCFYYENKAKAVLCQMLQGNAILKRCMLSCNPGFACVLKGQVASVASMQGSGSASATECFTDVEVVHYLDEHPWRRKILSSAM